MANAAEVFKKRLLWLARNGEPARIIHSGAVGVEHREPVELGGRTDLESIAAAIASELTARQ